MPPSPCPNDPTHRVEWDETVIDRVWCPTCNLAYLHQPAPEGERLAYKDGD